MLLQAGTVLHVGTGGPFPSNGFEGFHGLPWHSCSQLCSPSTGHTACHSHGQAQTPSNAGVRQGPLLFQGIFILSSVCMLWKIYITCHGTSNYWHIDCLFNSSCKPCITSPLWRESVTNTACKLVPHSWKWYGLLHRLAITTAVSKQGNDDTKCKYIFSVKTDLHLKS